MTRTATALSLPPHLLPPPTPTPRPVFVSQANFGIDILLLGAAAAEDTIVVSSVFGELYSTDGGP